MINREVLVDLWWDLFNWCWMSGMVPSVWKSSVVVPVPKKRSKGAHRTDELQGISLVSVAYKVMCKQTIGLPGRIWIERQNACEIFEGVYMESTCAVRVGETLDFSVFSGLRQLRVCSVASDVVVIYQLTAIQA